jgi:uncharacterized RDD family membrane protein YckC
LDQFWVIRNGARTGPFSEDDVLRAYRDGTLRGSDLLWADGVAAPVTVAAAFAQLDADVLPIERSAAAAPKVTTLSLEPIESAARSLQADPSPYRPPATALEDRPGTGSRGEPRYAGFWVRYGASVIDTFILFVIALVIGIVLALVSSGGGRRSFDWLGFGSSLAVTWLYLALGESSAARATWGKRAFHLQVLDADYLGRISFARATGRFAARYVSILALMIGYLIQPFNGRKRALHDFIAGTVVVVERDYSRLLVALMIVLGLIVPVAVIGLGGAVVLPAYQTYAVRQKVAAVLSQVTPATVAVQEYLSRAGQVPGSLEETGFDARQPLSGISAIQYTPGSGVIAVTLGVEPVVGKTVQVVPARIDNNRIFWACRPGTLQPDLIPEDCPPGATR